MTVQEFLAALDAGLYEDNLSKMVRGLSSLIKSSSGSRERTAFHTIQAVLADTLDYWFDGQAIETQLLKSLEADLIPRIKEVVASLSHTPEDQFRAMDALIKDYLSHHPSD